MSKLLHGSCRYSACCDEQRVCGPVNRNVVRMAGAITAVAGVAALAAWQRGHAVALPPNAAPETVRALRRRGGVVALLHDTDTPDEFDVRAWLPAAELSDGPGPEVLAAIDGARVIATVYTSGSTGAHQACPKTAAQLLGEAATLAGCFGVTAARRVVATVPPHHLYGLLFSVLMPLAAGASFVRETPLHAETVAATARRHAADLLVSVPIHLRSLTVLDPGELPAFAGVFSSGAALPSETAAALGGLGLAVTEIYGAAHENRSGNRNTHGIYPVVKRQSDRAKLVRRTLEEVVRTPSVIGVDWFQYADEPLHGRGVARPGRNRSHPNREGWWGNSEGSPCMRSCTDKDTHLLRFPLCPRITLPQLRVPAVSRRQLAPHIKGRGG